MIKLNHTTLVCIDTKNIKLALNAIRRTLYICDFKEILFFTDTKKLESFIIDSRINLVNVQIESAKDYSSFVINELHKFISTESVMIIQWDGFPLEEKFWRPEFLAYDYIGAPWPGLPGMNRVEGIPDCTPDTRVGNGGFSIRSRNLLELTSKIESNLDKTLEDVYISRGIRKQLNDFGMLFAPYELAERFSCENCVYDNQFGFHGTSTIQFNNSIRERITE